MSTRAMREEIWNQAEDLPNFARQLRTSGTSKPKPSRLLFAGSGDSYATALFAQALSGGQALGSDPYELLTRIGRIRGKSLVVISISGKTRTNVELARKARGIAKERIALTANASSPLAGVCDRTVLLNYRKSGKLTSGTVSFTCGLLACAYLLRRLPAVIGMEIALRRSLVWASRVRSTARGSFVFVGSGVNHTMALYGAGKIREVIGGKAEAEYPEQLGHSRLFSIDKKHDTIVCIHSGADKTWQLCEILRRSGFNSYPLGAQGADPVVSCVRLAIYLQQLALVQAQDRGMKECAFLNDRKRLDLSNKLIY